MSSHKFSVGQDVEFLPGFMDYVRPPGAYVITRVLPDEGAGPCYHARSLKDGVERVFSEGQLRASPPPPEASAVRHGRSGHAARTPGARPVPE